MMVPTHRLRVIDTENAMSEILAFLEQLAAAGERPWCEVLYPPPPHADPAQWEIDQEATFDAVELVDGEIRTLPPYAELRGAE